MAYNSKKMVTYAAIGILIATMIFASTMQIQFTSATGTLTILVTDPPKWGNVTQVYINITSIEIHRNGSSDDSPWIIIPLPEGEYIELNLTSILDTEAVLVPEVELGPGKYNQIRFEIMNATVTVNGENVTARVPSGKLKINIKKGGVTVEEGETTFLLLDIETKVNYSKGKGYMLVPSAKAVPIE